MQKDKIEECTERLIFLLPDISKAFQIQHPQEVFKVDISISEISVLRHLFFNKEPSMMSEIGKKLSMDLSTLTRVVDKLVKKDLVIRKPSQKDRRVIRIAMSPRGRGIGEKFKEKCKERIRFALKQMTSQEISILLNLLETIHIRIYGEKGAL